LLLEKCGTSFAYFRYHNSRGIQLLSALYAFNCPTFLFTQKQWKLFVENTERNAITTFPYDMIADHTPHVNSSLVQPMGTTFLKAIVICILSNRESQICRAKATPTEETSQVLETPQKTTIKRKYFDTGEKPQRQSGRIKGRSELPDSVKKVPSFISGYVDGKPIYRSVRVVEEDIVTSIENNVMANEKIEQSASQITLIE
jgi:hypothetical protein